MENKIIEKIMLVDDDHAANTFHKIMIEEANLGSVVVSEHLSVDEALKHMENCMRAESTDVLPQVILVDLNLPKKSGWDFVEGVKALDLKSFFPLIYIVTNSENPADINKANMMDEVVGLMPKYLESDFFAELGATINRRRAS